MKWQDLKINDCIEMHHIVYQYIDPPIYHAKVVDICYDGIRVKFSTGVSTFYTWIYEKDFNTIKLDIDEVEFALLYHKVSL